VLFERAYTPTPHTSYALSSLFTGKFLRQVLSLPNAPSEHPALPELLREHGYRTAAFYPPAVFFVDAERFKTLAERRFGFEYAKEMFAPAAERVRQLDRYLAQVEAGRSLFVWVHLFEPHEPYDPPPAFARGERPVERYDAEVSAADAAVGELVRTFRRSRPGALVIVTSDHGEEFGEHGGEHHGTSLYDEQVRVPLLWSAPGKLAAHVAERPRDSARCAHARTRPGAPAGGFGGRFGRSHVRVHRRAAHGH
jgi:arylsulfatase A-like enzyme